MTDQREPNPMDTPRRAGAGASLQYIGGMALTVLLAIACAALLLYALSNGRLQDLAEFYRGAPAPSPTTHP